MSDHVDGPSDVDCRHDPTLFAVDVGSYVFLGVNDAVSTIEVVDADR